MTKRKTRKVVKPKRNLPKLQKEFDCPFCQYYQCISISINRNKALAHLSCRICHAKYTVASVPRISEAVDIYGDWLDRCMDLNNKTKSTEPASSPQTSQESAEDEEVSSAKRRRLQNLAATLGRSANVESGVTEPSYYDDDDSGEASYTNFVGAPEEDRSEDQLGNHSESDFDLHSPGDGELDAGIDDTESSKPDAAVPDDYAPGDKEVQGGADPVISREVPMTDLGATLDIFDDAHEKPSVEHSMPPGHGRGDSDSPYSNVSNTVEQTAKSQLSRGRLRRPTANSDIESDFDQEDIGLSDSESLADLVGNSGGLAQESHEDE